MAVASYTTDLTSFESWEASGGSSSTLEEMTGYTVTQANTGDTADPDNPIQGTLHASIAQRNTGQGSLVAVRPTGISLAAGEAFFFWATFLQSRAINSFANDGLVGFVGTGPGAYYRWTIGGNDFGRNPYGGYTNYVCDPTISTANAVRVTQGSPGTTYDHVGFGCDVQTAINRGNPYNLDAIYYGRGEAIVTGGTSTDADATFDGLASTNDDNANRWGLFQEQFGSYLWKGLLTLGTSAAAVEFTDKNKAIFIDDVRVVASDFNKIEINNTASNITWTNINISSLGSVSRGQFEMVDGASFSADTCVFTDMGTFTFQKGTGNCNIKDSTFRRCDNVTSNGATFDNCTFDSQETAGGFSIALDLTNASGSADAAQIANIPNCTFISPGVDAYAIDLGTISSNVAVSVDLDNVTFDGYTAGSLGNFSNQTAGFGPNFGIFVTYTGTATLTINVINDSTIPSIINTGSGTVTLAAPPRNFKLTGLKDRTEVRLVNSSTNTEIAGVENVIGGVGTGINNGGGAVTVSGTTDNNTFNYAYQYSSDINILAAVLSSSTYEVIYLESSLQNSDKDIPVQQQIDRNSNL